MKFIVPARMIFILGSAINLAELPIQLNKIGLSVGVVVATFTFFQITFLLLGNRLSTWLSLRVRGHRNVALGSVGLFVCSQVLYFVGAYYKEITAFFLAQTFHAVSFALFFPLSNTLMEQIYTKGSERKHRGLYQTFIRSSEKIGALVGVSLGASHLNLVTWAFGIGAAFLVFFLLYFDNFPELEETKKKLSWKNWRNWIDESVLKAIHPAFLIATVQGMLLVSGSLYLIANGVSPVVLTIGQWFGIGSMTFFGFLTQKKGNPFVISISLFCLMAGLIGLIYTPHLDHFAYPGYLVTGFLLGTSTSGGFLCFQNIAQETADKQRDTLLSSFFGD